MVPWPLSLAPPLSFTLSLSHSRHQTHTHARAPRGLLATQSRAPALPPHSTAPAGWGISTAPDTAAYRGSSAPDSPDRPYPPRPHPLPPLRLPPPAATATRTAATATPTRRRRRRRPSTSRPRSSASTSPTCAAPPEPHPPPPSSPEHRGTSERGGAPGRSSPSSSAAAAGLVLAGIRRQEHRRGSGSCSPPFPISAPRRSSLHQGSDLPTHYHPSTPRCRSLM